MLRAFSLLYWGFFVLSLPILFAVALVVFAATAPFDRRRLASHLFSCCWGSFYVVANPLWRMRVHGRDRLPWHGAAVLVANHLSLLDVLVLYGLFRPFKYVAKGEVFRIPFVGWNMALSDYVPIWRGDRESVRRMMDRCRVHLARGVPVLLFPEGTRSPDGRLQPFKDGAFRLALELGCPVFPIAVSGTGEALPKHGVALRGRMEAVVRVLDPLLPAAHPSVEALKAAARDAIAAALPPENRP
ncbi:MAG TPA: lysophospholipid acyltransferase family protein [Anaeromyxobacter sp.]